jgi:DNA-binding NarL/FixJ family response regulator
MIRVLIVDDESLIRSGLGALLSDEEDIHVVGEAADGDEAVAEAVRTHPDVILMDIQMPNTDGIEATRRIAAVDGLARSRVLIATSFPGERRVVEAIRAGAAGFVVKGTTPQELIRAVRVVASGGATLSPEVTTHLIADVRSRPAEEPIDASLLATLTPREREVMALVAKGLNNSQLAKRLFITPATAKTHVSRVLAKLGLQNRAQLVRLAYETGVATPCRGSAPIKTRSPSER